MTDWTLPYLRTTIPPDASAEEFERKVAETLVALHRYRSEGIVVSRRFYVIRNRADQDDVKVGFVEDSLSEQFLARNPLAQRVSDTTLNTVRRVVG